MSFGGSSSSFTLPHTHNNSLSNDGGALSQTLTFMGGVTLYSLITGTPDPQTAINTAAIGTNTTNIAALTANIGKWSATNTATFRNSVIAGVPVGTIEEVT
tara:strand:- start:826 stop:1128 length:303 start_codon:yes stop_codon:yes gene_type:complete